jgi:hypothetical protein
VLRIQFISFGSGSALDKIYPDLKSDPDPDYFFKITKSESKFEDDNARFTTILLNLYLTNNVKDIVVFLGY